MVLFRSALKRRCLAQRRSVRFSTTKPPPLRTPTLDLTAALRRLDTTVICDADRRLRAMEDGKYRGINPLHDLPMIPTKRTTTMAGVVRTVKLNECNDFLGVIQGILQANAGEVLVIDALHSYLAIAGELLAGEAELKKLEGLVILDGYMRDTAGLAELTQLTCFASGVTPYAGTCMFPGEMQCDLTHSDDNIEIRPGDIMVGDQDGVVVGSVDTMERLLPVAQEIFSTESVVRSRQKDGESLVSLCNIEEHLEKRLAGEESQFSFKKWWSRKDL